MTWSMFENRGGKLSRDAFCDIDMRSLSVEPSAIRIRTTIGKASVNPKVFHKTQKKYFLIRFEILFGLSLLFSIFSQK